MPEDAETSPPEKLSPGTFESFGKKLDERPEIQAAEEAVRRAREQLEQAQHYCSQLRDQTAAEWQDLREANFRDLVDKSLAFVRKNPGVGVAVAAVLGFFIGRIFRR